MKQKIFSLNIDEEEVPIVKKMHSENSSVNSSQFGSHRARSVSFHKTNKSVKNNNNIFYDLEEKNFLYRTIDRRDAKEKPFWAIPQRVDV